MNDTGLVVRFQRKRHLLFVLLCLAIPAGAGGYRGIKQHRQAEWLRLNEMVAPRISDPA